MSQKTHFTCDVCGHAISGKHQELYMARVTIDWTETVTDGGITTESRTDTYHVHNDFGNSCVGKIWDVLRNKK